MKGPNNRSSGGGTPWYSEDAGKARTEGSLLAWSLAWIAAVAVVVMTGFLRRWGEVEYHLFSLACAATVTVGPIASGAVSRGGLASSYLLKLNVYCAILVFFGTYVGTHYFFDLMRMRYAFPAQLTFEAELVGKSGGEVPAFMYPLTQAYFVTYFNALVVAERGLRRLFGLGRAGRVVLVAVLSYAVAFAETFFMATEFMSGLFWYEERGSMLLVGSFGYAIYFLVGLPLVRDLDERPGAPWPLGRVVIVALAASMLIFFGLEAWAKVVGEL